MLSGAPIAQLVEQQTFNLWVVRSSRTGGTKNRPHRRWGEWYHNLVVVELTGVEPVSTMVPQAGFGIV